VVATTKTTETKTPAAATCREKGCANAASTAPPRTPAYAGLCNSHRRAIGARAAHAAKAKAATPAATKPTTTKPKPRAVVPTTVADAREVPALTLPQLVEAAWLVETIGWDLARALAAKCGGK
jgi:hypothetical protein